jgi:hypothetical protein
LVNSSSYTANLSGNRSYWDSTDVGFLSLLMEILQPRKILGTIFGLKCLKIVFWDQFWAPRLTHPPSQLASLGSHASIIANHASCSLPDMVDELFPELQEDQAPNNLDTTGDVGKPCYMTAIHETAYKKMEWHIARLFKTSAKACFAQQAITKKKCEAKIVHGNKPTAARIYTDVMLHVHKKKPKVMEFFFYNDDIERCVKGTKRRWVKSRLDVPSIWPVKIGTNLSTKEILDLENTNFQLSQRTVISPRRLFGMEELPFNLASFPTLASPDEFPKTRSGKSIRRNNNAPTTKQANNCASSLTLKGQIHKVTMIPHLGYGCIVILDSGAPPKVQQYLITIGAFHECSCEYFKDMATKSFGKRRGGQVASIFILSLLS